MNLVSITITSEEVTEKSGVKDGKPWLIREQAAVLETADRRQPVKLSLGKTQSAHKAGKYVLDFVRNLRVTDFGSIQLVRSLELTPAK